jgi:undecaprenyl-diphosphatase
MSRSEGLMHRHAGDALRLVLAVALFAIAALVARRPTLSASEVDAFRVFNDLPGAGTAVAWPILALASVPAVAAAFVVALATRRTRLAFDLLSGAALALGIGKFLHSAAIRRGPAGFPARLAPVHHLTLPRLVDYGNGFPSAAVAVVAAAATGAGPYLPRPLRRAAWAGVFAVGAARLYAGVDLPVDVIAGMAMGWAVGAALNLVLGAPTGHPSIADVRDALELAGIPLKDLGPLGAGDHGDIRFAATMTTGAELSVRVLGREERSADLLLRAWRFAVFTGAEEDVAFTSRHRQVEHEAFLGELAARAGVRVPRVVLAGRAGRGVGFLAQERVVGRRLDDLTADEVDDDVLAAAWAQVATMHDAHIAHRRLRRHSFLVDEDGVVWLDDWVAAELGPRPAHVHRDVVELLVSLAVVVGASRAAASALEVLGEEAVIGALPLLQPLALTTPTIRELRGRRTIIGELRDEILERTRQDAIPLAQVTRIRPRTILALAAGGFAVHLLLPQVGQLHQTLETIRHAHPVWLVVAALAAAVTYLAAAISQMGAVEQPLSLVRTTAVQLATTFANRVTPAGTGGLGLNERYLEREGVDRVTAVGAVGLNVLAGAVVHTVGVFVALAVLGRSGIGGVALPAGWGVLVLVVAALAALGIVLLAPFARRLRAAAARAGRDLWRVARRPRQAIQLFGGSSGVTLFNALALAASLAAFRAGASLDEVIVVYLGGSAVASVSPTPGSLGAVEAALVAGLTGVGVAAGPAVAGVLAFRLITFWLPSVPGFVAYRAARRRAWV